MGESRRSIKSLWNNFIGLVLSNKRISIGIVLYIAVFIISGIWSPWQADGLAIIEDFTEPADNMVMDIIPINILYFGIYELMQVMAYVNETYEANIGYGIMFLLSIYASFTYMQCILRKFIIREDSEDISIPAKLIIEFVYDNVLTYISCLLVYYIFPAVWNFTADKFTDFDLLAVMGCAVILLFIIIPGALQLIQMGTYMISMSLITTLLNFMDSKIEWHIVIKTVLIFAVASVLILLVNIVVNLILDRMIGRMVEGIAGFIISIPDDIRTMGGCLLGLLKFFAILAGILGIIMLAFLISGKSEGIL